MREHVKAAGHRLWVELDKGNVYCASCSDYVYDSELHSISVQHQSQAHKELGSVGAAAEPGILNNFPPFSRTKHKWEEIRLPATAGGEGVGMVPVHLAAMGDEPELLLLGVDLRSHSPQGGAARSRRDRVLVSLTQSRCWSHHWFSLLPLPLAVLLHPAQ